MKIRNKNLMELIKNDSRHLMFVKEQTEDFCLEVVAQDGLAIKYVNKKRPKFVWKQSNKTEWL